MSAFVGALLAAPHADASIFVKGMDIAVFEAFAAQVKVLTGYSVRFNWKKTNPDTGELRAMMVLDGSREAGKGNARAAAYLQEVIDSQHKISLELVYLEASVLFDDVSSGRVDVADLESFTSASPDFGAGQLVHVLAEQMYFEKPGVTESPSDARGMAKAKYDFWPPHFEAKKKEAIVVRPHATMRVDSVRRGREDGHENVETGDIITFWYYPSKDTKLKPEEEPPWRPDEDDIFTAEYRFMLDENLRPCAISSATVPNPPPISECGGWPDDL